MGVLARAWVVVQLFEHRSLLGAQLILSGLVLHALNDWLVLAGTRRVLHEVRRALVRRVLWTVFAHVGLRQVVGSGPRCRRHVVLLLWSLFSSNSARIHRSGEFSWQRRTTQL